MISRGAVIAIAASGNVHSFSEWALTLGNFAFYFGLAYLICSVYVRLSGNP